VTRVAALPGRIQALALLGLLTAAWIGRTAVTSPRVAVGLVVGLVLAAVLLERLVPALVLFTVVTFPNNLPTPIGIATLAKPLGLILTMAWLLALVTRGHRMPFLARDRPILSAAIVSYSLWAAASTVWASDSSAAFSNSLRLVQVVILLFIVYSAVQTPRDLRVLAWAYLVGAFVTSAYVLANGAVYGGRITGGVVNPNGLAAELVVALILAVFMLTITTRLRTRLLLLGLLALYAVAFVRTESREGLIGLLIASVVAVILAGPIRTRYVAILLLALAIGVTYYARLAPESLRARVTQISAENSAGRVDEWKIAFRMAADHPITGVGLANYPVVSPGYTAATISLESAKYNLRGIVVHNTYLETLSELGVIGLGLLLGIFGVVVAMAAKAVASPRFDEIRTSVIARGFIAGTIGLLVTYVFSSGEYQKQLWLLLGILLAIARLQHELSRGAAHPDEPDSRLSGSAALRRVPEAVLEAQRRGA
jgi:O-antigen ligase